MTNEEKFKKYKKKEFLRYLIITLNFSVIVLESFALFKVISLYWGFIPLFLSILVKFLYEKEVGKKVKKSSK